MNLFDYIEKNESCRKKYRYYRDLGYAEKAAAVFSVLTYGERALVYFFQQMNTDRRKTISALYDWLQNQGICTTLEWNQGNHFKDADIRTARAIAWAIKQSLGLLG